MVNEISIYKSKNDSVHIMADNMIFNIFWVNTNPKYKNQGIGSKLMKELVPGKYMQLPTTQLEPPSEL